MPSTHVDIQRERRRSSTLLFFILVIYYFLGLLIFWILAHPFLHPLIHSQTDINAFFRLTAAETGTMLVIALSLAAGHWLSAVLGGVNRILSALRAQPADPQDRYHQQLLNLVEEMRIASGGPRVRVVVIPTLATNAFAVATRDDNGVIGVTEGLLARLNRSQLQAVIAHETAHLRHKDGQLTTMACALFAVYAQLLRRLTTNRNDETSTLVLPPIFWPLLMALWLLKMGALLLSLAISRQRKYLADATAVQLTHHPTALAEALLKISSAWRGVGAIDEALAPIFILNPGESLLDQQDSIWANLFSTHPPINRRIEILTALARIDIPSLNSSLRAQQESNRLAQAQSIVKTPPDITWWIQEGSVWKGPYSVGQLLTLQNFRAGSWICRESWQHVTQAADDPLLLGMIREKTGGNSVASRSCPRCRLALTLIDYEGAQLYQCQFCLGHLVSEHNLTKVISRREIGFSNRLKAKAEQLQKHSMLFYVRRRTPLQRDSSRLLHCPKCQNPMIRNFYTYQYRVLIDRCHGCQLIWFDHEELDMLQAMIEAGTVVSS